MMEPITAVYVQEDEDWTITVTGFGKTMTARAPGIIAARDRTDQLVEKLNTAGKDATVVHLLNGSALEFTTVYMTARLTRPETAAAPEAPEAPEAAETAETSEASGKEPAGSGSDSTTPATESAASADEVAEPVKEKPKGPNVDLSNGKMAPIADALNTTKGAKPVKSPGPVAGSVTVGGSVTPPVARA
ncbi:hypothetical protein [Amycolatopsis nigrescens]|uniref:hypothetical protein n=1 Tax=Amycolatopsis nigrescens TaxID=381445 RepID=UPI0003744815